MQNNKLYQILFLVFTTLFFISCERLDMDEPGNLVPETTDRDGNLPSLTVNGIKLHLETFGDINNPIIVFIPGGPGTDYCALISRQGGPKQSRYPEKRTQNNLGLDQLSDSFFCIFFDPRGAGLSPRVKPSSTNISDYHNDLNTLIAHFLELKFTTTGKQDTAVTLAGHSFGGYYATSYVNEYPNKVNCLILFEPTPLSVDVRQSLNRTSVFSMLDEQWLNEYLFSLEHMSYDDHCRADYHKILGFSESFPELEYPDNVPLWRYGALINSELIKKTYMSDNFDITSNLNAFKGSALFVWGGKTRALDREGMEMQMAYFPKYEEITIPKTGHYMVWEKPDECSEAIRNFLNNKVN
jgi:proline iminopeptidase